MAHPGHPGSSGSLTSALFFGSTKGGQTPSFQWAGLDSILGRPHLTERWLGMVAHTLPLRKAKASLVRALPAVDTEGKRLSSECLIKRQLWRNKLHHLPLRHLWEGQTPPTVLHVQLALWSPRLAACASMAGQHGVCLAAEGVNMENHLVGLHVFVFSRLQYFFLIFPSLSLLFFL